MNFNKQPYFDDFDPEKNFHKVLFKPGLPVQVRELNQLQSIHHHQLEQFANHVFKSGSIVDGASVQIQETNFVTVNSIDPATNSPVNLNLLQQNYRVLGTTSGIGADIILSTAPVGTDPITLYINYTCAGTDGTTTTFIPGEVLEVYDDNNPNSLCSIKIRCPDCPGSSDNTSRVPVKGLANLWSIPESTYYVHGWFLNVPASVLIGEKFTSFTKSYKVGFDIVESIIDVNSDVSLFDNVLGYPNYNSPGADRFRISLKPVIRSLTYENEEKFIKLAEVESGKITYIKSKSEYAQLMDLLAERTYDESGNYTVTPFRIRLFEHLKSSKSPTGFYTEEKGGDDSLMVATISSGRAYVRGYQVDKIAETELILEKARDTNIMRDFYNVFGELQYILIKVESGSSFIPIETTNANVFANYSISIYNGVVANSATSGTQIGTLIPYDVEYVKTVSGSKIFKLFFTKITMNSGVQFSSAKSFIRNGTTVKFLASAVNDDISGTPRIYGTKGSLIWKIADYVKSTRDADNTTIRSLTYMSRRKFQAILDSNGSYTWNATSGEYFDSFNPLKTFGGTVSGGIFTEVNLTTGLTIAPTSITVTIAGGEGKTFIMFHNVLKSDALEKTKTLITRTETALKMNSDGIITLSKADGFRVRSVMSYPDSNPTVKTNVSELVNFYSGETDYTYALSYLKWDGVYDSTISFEVEYDYFNHGPGDFFSVDSYQNTINNPDIPDFFMGDIPTYTDLHNNEYLGRDCLDFRPLVIGGVMPSVAQPVLNGHFTLDLEYYLPRTDLIVVNKDGEIYQKKGISAERPLAPEILSDGSEMTLYKLTQKPFVVSAREDVAVSRIDNRRYTMEDIGKLEDKIQRVESATTLSLLESSALSSTIRDAAGMDRFKNGIITDDFHNFSNCFKESIEFKAALDTTNKILRPEFSVFPIEFELDQAASSTGLIKKGPMVMRSYTESQFIRQPDATVELVICSNSSLPIVNTGKVFLSPSFDNWADASTAENPFFNENTRKTELIKSGQLWESWKNVTSSFGPGANGSKVFARPRVFQFYASGLTPNTRVYFFFDKKNVTQYCKSWDSPTYGTNVVVDSGGRCFGEFSLPANTFFTGQRVFRITNSSGDLRDSSLRTCTETVISLGGIKYSVQDETLNTINPLTDIIRTRTINGNSIAQTFNSGINSCFVTSVDLYFKSISVQDEIYVQLVKTAADGTPDATTVLGEKVISGSNVLNTQMSTSATAALRFTFPYPVFIESRKTYALLISSKNSQTKIWVSSVGQPVVSSSPQRTTSSGSQPNVGSLYKRQSNRWVVSPSQDLKFVLNRANFSGTSTTFVLKNKKLNDGIVVTNPFETEAGSTSMRIYFKGHGMNVGDTFEPKFSDIVELSTISAQVSVGQVVVSVTGSGTVVASTPTNVKLSNISGYFVAGQSFTANSIRFTPNDSDAELSFYGILPAVNPVQAVTGTIETNWRPQFNGVSVEALNTTLTVSAVDTMESFIVQLPAPASVSGRCGGKVLLGINRKLDFFVLNGSFMKYTSTGGWTVNGIAATNYNAVNFGPVQFKEKYSLSSSAQVANTLNETTKVRKSLTLTGTFVAPNTWISPVLNVDTLTMVGGCNFVEYDNASNFNVAPNATGRFVEETVPNKGSAAYKYITKTVTLAQPAFDLKIMLGIHKPPSTTFDVYVKTTAPYSSEVINSKSWIKIESINKSFTCNDPTDFREVEFMLGDVMPATFGSSEFKEFKIKLVGRGNKTNTARPILFKNLRIVAVT